MSIRGLIPTSFLLCVATLTVPHVNQAGDEQRGRQHRVLLS